MFIKDPVKRVNIQQIRDHSAFGFCKGDAVSKLGTCTKKSYFNANCEVQQNAQGIIGGDFKMPGLNYMNPEELEDLKKTQAHEAINSQKQGKMNIIAGKLVTSHNINKLYFSTTKWLYKYYPERLFSIFLLAKATLIKACHEKLMIQNQRMVPENLIYLGCSKLDWEDFLKSDTWENCKLINYEMENDLKNIQNFFNAIYKKCKEHYKNPSEKITVMLNQNLKAFDTKTSLKLIQNVIKMLLRYGKDEQNEKNITGGCLFSLIYSYEIHNEKKLDDVFDFEEYWNMIKTLG